MPKKISLSLLSSAGTPYVIDFTIDESWIGCWQTPEKTVLLLQALNTQVLNRPYVDNPDFKTIIHNLTIFHPNHDSGHALRALVLTQFLRQIMQKCGNAETQKALSQLSEQEWQITLLAAYLYRAGRTNEESSLSGLSQNDRSAKLFSAIALALGYPKELTNTLASCIEQYAPVNNAEKLQQIPFSSAHGMTKEKLKVINGCLLLSHNSDLVRCWSKLQDIDINNFDNLSAFFPASQLSNLEYYLLHFARTLCQWTGADFYLHDHSNEQMHKAPEIYKVQCTMNVASTLQRLEFIMHEWLTLLPKLDIDKINACFKQSLQLQLPPSYHQAVQTENAALAQEAETNYTSMTSIQPYEQSKVSLKIISQRFLNKENLSAEEIATRNQSGLTLLEENAHHYLTENYPWTWRHTTKYFDAIFQIGTIYSTAELHRLGFTRSHTPINSGTQHFVFATIGSPDAEGIRAICTGLKSFTTSYRTLLKNNPFVISTPLVLKLRSEESETFQLFNHTIQINHKIFDQNTPHVSAEKTYIITRPDGTSSKLTVKFRDEIVAGFELMPFHSLKAIYLLRFFDEATRQSLLKDPKGKAMQQWVDLMSGMANCELLLPGKLNIHDHHISFSESDQEKIQREITLNKLKSALLKQDNTDLLELLAEGVSPDFAMDQGLTPLATLLITQYKTLYLQNKLTLINAGASITHHVNGQSIFSIAVSHQQYLLVESMLARQGKGDVVAVNADTPAIYIALKKHDITMLDLLEQYGLNYSGCNYNVLLLLLEKSEFSILMVLARFKAHQFDFTKQTTLNQDGAANLIKSCLNQQKIKVLNELLSLGILTVAVNSAQFTPELYQRLQSQLLLKLPKLNQFTSTTVQAVQLFLVTHDQKTLLIRAHHGQQTVPYWHGISGEITGEINDATIAQLCLNEINWRPQIAKFTRIKTPEHETENAIVVHLKPGSIPLVFATLTVTTGQCKTAEQWLKEPMKITDLARTVMTQGHIPQALTRQHRLIQEIKSHDTSLAEQHVYHPKQVALIKLVDTFQPNLRTLERLAKLGYSLNVTTTYEKLTVTPLILSVLHHNIELLTKLVELGADLHQRTGYEGFTVMHFALDTSNLPAVKQLHKLGFDFKHPAMQNFASFVKAHRITPEMQQFLISVGAIPATEPATDVRHLAKSDILQYDDLPAWLRHSGLDKKPDLEQRIQREHQITYFNQTTHPALITFESELKNLGILPQNFILAVADKGTHPVFECLALAQPVIAISRAFLKIQDIEMMDVVIGIQLAVLAYQHRQQQKNQYHELTAEHLESFDNRMIEEFGFSFEQMRHYLQIGFKIFNEYHDKNCFEWPHHMTTKKYWNVVNPYTSRIKLLLKSINSNQIKLSASKQVHLKTRLEDIRNHCAQIPVIDHFPDFPHQADSETRLKWLIAHLDSLFEDLFPWELCEQPSIQIKQFSDLVMIQSNKFLPYHFDKLLRAAFDRKIPAYAFLHARLNNIKSFYDYDCAQHPYGGYFKDMWAAALSFSSANDFDSAKKQSRLVLELYERLFPIFNFGTCSETYLYFGIEKNSTPDRFFKVRYGDYFLPYQPQLTLADNFDAWIVREYQTEKRLGSLWRAQWILGLWNGHLCELLPNEIWQHNIDDLNAYQMQYARTHSALIPNLYDGHKIHNYQDHFKSWRKEKLLYPTVAIDATEKQINEFVTKHQAHLFPKDGFTTLNPSQHSFLALLTQLEKTATGRNFIKFLAYTWSDCFGDFSMFMDFIIASQTFLKSEKIILWQECELNCKNSFLSRLFPKNVKFEIDVLPYFQDFHIKGINEVFSYFNEKFTALNVFDPNLLFILDFIQHNFKEKFHVSSKWIKPLRWQPVKDSKLSPSDFARLFRLLDANRAFEDWSKFIEFRIELIEQLKKIEHIDELEEAVSLLLCISERYINLRISDEVLLQQVIELFAARMIKHFGPDDGSSQFAARVQLFLTKWFAKVLFNDFNAIAEKFMHGILAQPFLCHWFTGALPSQEISADYLVMLIDTMSIIGEVSADKYALLDFLAEEVTNLSLNTAVNKIENNERIIELINQFHRNNSTYEKPTFDQYCFWLRILHQTFWMLSIEQRAYAVDMLICPSKTEQSDQEKSACYLENVAVILKKVLGDELTSARNQFTVSLVKAFLAASVSHERQFLLAALICAVKQTTQQSSLGSKLAILFANMGPAFIKLGQAIHSHPDTPQDIRDDLAKMKSDVAIPPRWKLISLIEKSVSREIYLKIAYFGEILGAASYHIAIKVCMQDGNDRVLLLTRDDAERLAKKGFAHLQRTAQLFNDPQFNAYKATGLDILSHAEAMSRCELDFEIGNLQHAMAEKVYGKPEFQVSFLAQKAKVKLRACQSYASGSGFRLLEFISGVSFNKLPATTPQEKNIRKYVALAIVKTELAQILSGNQFDCDRHGEQAKIQFVNGVIQIGLFDFGEMGISEITKAQRNGLSTFLRELPGVFRKGGDMYALMQKHIQNAADPSVKNHLLRTQKAILALSDYLRELAPEIQLSSLIKEIVPTIHPEYRSALISGYTPNTIGGWFQFFANEVSELVSSNSTAARSTKQY